MTELEETNTLTPVSTGTSTPLELSKDMKDCLRKGKKARRQKNSTFKEPKFTGHTEELKDIFDLNYNMLNQ